MLGHCKWHLASIYLLLYIASSVVIAETPCQNPRNQSGVCIPLTECTSLKDILNKKPIREEDRTFLRESQCGFETQPLVCCTDPRSRISLLPEPGVCGISTDNRIVGGTRTELDEFGWLVLLEYTSADGNREFRCGGALISDRYVLTAAHCISGRDFPEGTKLTSVRLGEWEINTRIDCFGQGVNKLCAPQSIDVPIEKTISHREYNSDSLLNDIALIRLSKSVPFSEFVVPLCLPMHPELRSKSFADEYFDVAGWGVTETMRSSSVKLKVRVKAKSNEDCGRIYGRENIRVSDGQICAGGEPGKDACKGDSGGPLMGWFKTEQGKDFWFLAGVVSYGSSTCGLRGWPTIYTRATSYIDWIEQNIRP